MTLFLPCRLFCTSVYTLCIMQTSRIKTRPVGLIGRSAVCLMKLQEYRFEKKSFFKNIFKDYIHLKKNTKLQKNKFKRQILTYRPCFDATRFQVPCAREALCIASISYPEPAIFRRRIESSGIIHNRKPEILAFFARLLHSFLYQQPIRFTQIHGLSQNSRFFP